MSTQSATKTQVAVIGAGIGGLAAALFLRARGFEVSVFEANSRSRVEESTVRGNGIHLYFHCARMLHRAGLPLDQYLTPLDIQMRRDDGTMRADISRTVQLQICPALKVIRASTYSLLRQHLYRVLVEHTPRDSLHCDKRCTGVTQHGDRVEVLFDDRDAITADFVVGADGIHSVLADQFFGPRRVNKHGIVIVQGLSSYDGLDPIETWLLHRNGGTMGLVPVILPSQRPGTFWWITVARSELDDSGRTDLASYQSVCTRYSWNFVHRVAAHTDPLSLERWYSQDKIPLRRWFWGRVAMLGDACHASTPFSGYGAGMSIEDGYWLAHFLGHPGILGRPRDLYRALTDYQARRAAWTARIVRQARVLMRTLHPPNRLAATGINTLWRTGLPAPLIARKFVSVFEQGLNDTEWAAHEVDTGKLDL
ncbi:MAG: FAD-dependent monooxygenase [Proteobacteria bacterium]|nr:FAD-dependent monooxygenase [Pseudomonadota bacterium]